MPARHTVLMAAMALPLGAALTGCRPPGAPPTTAPSPTPAGPTATATPTLTPSVTPTPTWPADARVVAPSLNVRLGPQVRHPAVGALAQGTTVAVRGREASGPWLVVEAADGTLGWVHADYLDVRVALTAVPTVPTPSPPPPPTETPVPMDPAVELLLAPPAVAQGEALTVRLRAPGAAQAVAALDPVTIPLFPVGDGRFEGVLPVAADLPPGDYTVHATTVAPDGSPGAWAAPLAVRDAHYPTEVITLTDATIGLLDERLRADELARLAELWTPATPQRLWSAPWDMPLAVTSIASGFGTVRHYEPGDLPGWHTGVDLRGAEGTGVHAPAEGQVVFAAPLEARGNTVILDHGWGVHSAYFHMSTLAVAPGDAVPRGGLLGTIGATGMVTGPHLHWEVRVDGVAVHPGPFLRGVGLDAP